MLFYRCMFIHTPGLFLWCCMTRIATIEAALDADQLQAWQAFYDGVSGMSSCSKCNKRDDPCSCGWGSNYYGPGVLCEGNSITKISLYSCSLSGPIPSEIGALTALTQLALSYNQLTGKISTTLYQNPIQKSHQTTRHKF